MMKNSQLPAGRGAPQLLFQPADLRRVAIRRVEHVEIQQSFALLDRVIVSSTHVKQRISALILAPLPHIVITQHRVEAHRLLEQSGKRLFKMSGEVTSAAVGVDVIAGSDCKIKWRTPVRLEHLFSNADLIAVTCSKIANHWKTQQCLHRSGAKSSPRCNRCSGSDRN